MTEAMSPPAATTTNDLMKHALTIALACMVTWAIVLPRLLPIGMAILAIVLVIAAFLLAPGGRSGRAAWGAEGGALAIVNEHAVTAGLLVFAVYSAISTIWSPVHGAALVKVLWLIMLILMGGVAERVLTRLPADARSRAKRGITAGCLIGGTFVTWEVLSSQEFSRFLFNSIAVLHPGPSKHVTLDNGVVQSIGPWVLNRNLGALNLLLWPTLCCLAFAGVKGRRAVVIAVVLVVATAIASMRSVHESSQIAIVVASLVFLVSRLNLAAGRVVVLAGWTAASLAMLPVVTLAHKSGLHTVSAIPDTGQARIILWNFTAQKYLERPFLGVGASATKFIDDALKPADKVPQGQLPYADRTGQHGHNVFVQVWFELGAVGAILFFVSGVLAWRAIGRMSASVQPYALAAATSAMCIAALTWGFWQEWYLSLFALASLVTMLAASQPATGDEIS
jgi:hypothetical protein